MAIWVFEGKQGQGKTTAGVAILFDAYNEGRDIVTNVDVTFPEVEVNGKKPTIKHFTMEYLKRVMNSEEKLEHTTLFVDELHRYMPSRRSSSKENVAFGQFSYEVRKRDVDFYGSSHRLHMVDLWFRQEASVRGACRFYPEKPCRVCKGTGTKMKLHKVIICDRCDGYGETGLLRIHWLDIDGIINPNRRGKNLRYVTTFEGETAPHKYWHLFDTHERVSINKKLVDFSTAEVR